MVLNYVTILGHKIRSQISTETKFVDFRALFDIVQDDAAPPILVWRESGEKNTSGYMTSKF